MIETIEVKISVEAVRLANNYPELTVKQALEKAKEIYGYDKNWKIKSINRKS